MKVPKKWWLYYYMSLIQRDERFSFVFNLRQQGDTCLDQLHAIVVLFFSMIELKCEAITQHGMRKIE